MQAITLTITRAPDGAITVEGPLHDKGVCYALLECGRDAIKDHHDKLTTSPIVRAPILPRGLNGSPR